MKRFFYPNNDAKARATYTGRADDLQIIFDKLKRPQCLAIYGERRSGKTTTLRLINEIINGNYENTLDEFIDKYLKSKMQNEWSNYFEGFNSIYITLQGQESEASLTKKIYKRYTEAISANPSYKKIEKLEDLFTRIQNNCRQSNTFLVILFDEMEVLETFENQGRVVAELCCNRADFPNLLFVYTGSYNWKTRVSSPGSVFTNLSEYYLRSICEKDMRCFLLQPFQEEKIKDFIVYMSGGKPLYAQYIGEILMNRCSSDGHIKQKELRSKTLFKDIDSDLLLRIDECIFNERNLDEISKRILALLAHQPNQKESSIAKKLKLEKERTRKLLETLSKFGTLIRDQKTEKYSIAGKVIQEYGKTYYSNPMKKKHTRQILHWLMRFTFCSLLIAMSVKAWSYTHPDKEVIVKKLENLKIELQIQTPKSLESNEEGEFNIQIKNLSSKPLTDFHLELKSDNLVYQGYIKNNKGEKKYSSSIIIPIIRKSHWQKIRYEVLGCQASKDINSNLYIKDRTISFSTKCRLPIKKFVPLIQVLASIVGILSIFPGGLIKHITGFLTVFSRQNN
ncbi:ATP-binding protein [filamentous cyanobacterium LEGE 11480]|uniref:ATP-binding protein n=1 Tax=Romeriopsis navalis LEGE 11480 TaxID=2777977 RepID=A0A928VNV2_9CYAN|nr:ATP-binding protein [Romeriopsis navalis]MBE9031755.1 ATP-binding protein [Romeriopsis navalis LEGE 11480]